MIMIPESYVKRLGFRSNIWFVSAKLRIIELKTARN